MNYNIYKKSVNFINDAKVCIANDGKEDFIISSSDKLGFIGEKSNGNIIAPLCHENAVILRKLFPFTAPTRVLNKDRSFGVGDRLGIAASGHIKIFEQYDAYPVLVQQSIRELNLTKRTYEDVLDCVTFAVFKEGYKKGFGADGDHLKTEEDIKYALNLGFTMITLDCSEHIKEDFNYNDFEIPDKIRETYLNKSFDIGEGHILAFNEDELKEVCSVYLDAIKFAEDMYVKFLKDGKYEADFEISIDETNTPTTPLAHFFVANELKSRGVKFASIAPRFFGEFQKGIDYIGDITKFEQEMELHAIIARHFGYKISIHSGSDKFSVFPIIADKTKGVFHVKTAGTNWLEAMKVVAMKDAKLFREIYEYAKTVFNDAKKYYQVKTNLEDIKPIDSTEDSLLADLLNKEDVRQLIHITYGYILNKYKDKLYKLWKENESAYQQRLKEHIGKHLEMLGVKCKN